MMATEMTLRSAKMEQPKISAVEPLPLDTWKGVEQIFIVKVTAESADHSDGVNTHYVLQAYANNGEMLATFRGEGNHLAHAAADFARNVAKAEKETGTE